jgi:DNA (cytosine-5)-methyltransferase 1
MSWLFSQALAEEYLGGTSLDGEQSVQSSGNPTQQAYCAPDKMTVFSRLSRFGMTFGPLTEDRGEELLTWFSGGFPCQDISAAGKGAGIDGERSGMWHQMARVVGEVRPRYVFVENSPMLVTRGLERVLADLTTLGYDTRWTVMGAADVGAPHQRDRIWIVARDTNGINEHSERRLQTAGVDTGRVCQEMAHPMRDGLQRVGQDRGVKGSSGLCGGEGGHQEQGLYMAHPQDEGNVRGNWSQTNAHSKTRGGARNSDVQWWNIEPNVGRVVDGVAARVDRLKAIGNGQVSEVARRAWQLLIN